VPTTKEAASEFLASKRIAVTGVSPKPKEHGSSTVYKRLRDRGYEVFAVNPSADEAEGARSYQDLKSIPGGVDPVVIATAPDKADGTMRGCAELGIKKCGCVGPMAKAAAATRPRSTGASTASPSSTADAR
jgi:predicted CoA-binding protein